MPSHQIVLNNFENNIEQVIQEPVQNKLALLYQIYQYVVYINSLPNTRSNSEFMNKLYDLACPLRKMIDIDNMIFQHDGPLTRVQIETISNDWEIMYNSGNAGPNGINMTNYIWLTDAEIEALN